MNQPVNIRISALVSRVKSGDKNAYTQLFKYFGPKLINTAKRMFVTQEDAEELSQEIFLHVWKKRDQLNPELSFNAYLLTILKSKLYKKSKSEARKVAYQKYAVQDIKEGTRSTENQVMFDELQAISSKAIENLPKQQKQIFLWKGMENFSSDEIANKLGLSRRTVENHFYQATKKLRAEIQKEYAQPLKKLFILIMSCVHFIF